MERVLRNFKTIPCPKGDRCTKPECQWQHSWDKDTGAAPAGEGSQDEDGPRKRRKLSSEPADPASIKATLPSAQRPVSPPALKRKAPQPSSKPDETAPLPKPPQVSGASTSPKNDESVMPEKTPACAVKPTKAVARKPEALNPRHLKSASPAGHDFRYKAMKLLHEQFVRLNDELKKDAKDDEKRLVLSAQELRWLALDEEERIATDKPSIYQNVIKNRIMAYKKMSPGQWKAERAAEHKKKEARKTTPGRAQAQTAKPDLGPPKVIQTGLTPQQEVTFLTYLLTPIDSLAKYGYVSTAPTDQEVAKAREGEELSRGWEECDRCSTRFQVFPGRREEDGLLASGGQCVHHPGRAYYPARAPGETGKSLRRYRCCQQAVGDSAGCATGSNHVFKTTSPARLAAVIPFAETPPNPLVPKNRAVCFDCEMGYTVYGLELIRLTATSWPDGKELLDVLVRPVGEVLDLNSRYSGVWPEDLVNAEPWSAEKKPPTQAQPDGEAVKDGQIAQAQPATGKKKMQIVPSPKVARDLLFSLLAPDTPLIGHGLENDLNAARIIHPTVIDTILLFPHRQGLPMRHGLKMLMETRLNRAIQVETAGKATGHDSAEDARAAGELVRLKVQERWSDMKAQGWRVVDGEFVPPGGGGGDKGALSEAFIEEGAVVSG